MKNLPKSLYDPIEKMSYKHPFYFYVLNHFQFNENDSIDTMGVHYVNKKVHFEYNPRFCETLTTENMIFALIHECDHILTRHIDRMKSISANHQTSNIAQDMVINENIHCFQNINFIKVNKKIKEFFNNDSMVVGDDFGITKKGLEKQKNQKYDGRLIFEDVYAWLNENENNGNNGNNDSNNNDSNNNDNNDSNNNDNNDSKDSNNNDNNNNDSKDSSNSNQQQSQQTFDEHLEDDEQTTDVDKKVFNEKLIESAKNRGIMTGNIEEKLKKLTKVKKDYMKIFKKSFSSMMGTNKKRTWKKPHRTLRNRKKGFSKINKDVNVLLDTSGSMSSEFERVLSHINKSGYTFNLIQCDTEVKDSIKINNVSKLKNLKIKGLGGTALQPGIDYIVKNLNDNPLVILTDGGHETLNLNSIKNDILYFTSGFVGKLKGGKVKKIITIEN